MKHACERAIAQYELAQVRGQRLEARGIGIGSNVKSIEAGTLGNVMTHIVANMGGAAWRSWKVVY